MSIKHFCDHCGVELRGQWWNGTEWGDMDGDFCHDCYAVLAHKHRQRRDEASGSANHNGPNDQSKPKENNVAVEDVGSV